MKHSSIILSASVFIVLMVLMIYVPKLNDELPRHQLVKQSAGERTLHQRQLVDQPAVKGASSVEKVSKTTHPPESLLLHPSEVEMLNLPLFLRDITPDPKEFNIYQLVTSLPETMSLRHFCSLESYCLENPNATVWFLFLDIDSIKGNQLRILRGMHREYPKLQLASLDLQLTVKDTPLESIITTGQLEKSAFLANHLSDVLRLAVVSKAGGLYTDFDFICLRSVSDVQNSMALELPNAVMNGLFHFDAGHPFLQLVMVEDGINFNPKHWSWNGPHLFTRILKEYCRGFHFKNPTKTNADLLDTIQKQLKIETSEPFPAKESVNATSIASTHDPSKAEDLCRSVKLLHPSYFMPLYAGAMKEIFQPGSVERLYKVPGDSYALHLFNRITKKTPLVEGSALHVLAQRYCPQTYATLHNSSMAF